jgi:transcriptional regulator with XRE-family HTH domain
MLNLEQIKEKLSDKNLSEVGRRIGVTRAYLSAICRGYASNPSYQMLKKISDYLEVDNEPKK